MIPQNKFDIEAVERLKTAGKEYIINNATELLEWLQDCNWPVAGPLAKVLAEFTNEIDDNIVMVLKSEDSMWKTCVINYLIGNSKILTSNKIISSLKDIINNPSFGDKIEENDEYSKNVLEVLNIKL